jgi:hypothetical protein
MADEMIKPISEWTEDDRRDVAKFGACELHEHPVPRTFRLDRAFDPDGQLAGETLRLICPACTAAAGEPREGQISV